MKFKLPFGGGDKERSGETNNPVAVLTPTSIESSETSAEELTPQEESTAGYYARTAKGRSLKDIREDLSVQYKDPESVKRVLQKIEQLREEKAKDRATEEDAG